MERERGWKLENYREKETVDDQLFVFSTDECMNEWMCHHERQGLEKQCHETIEKN